MERHKGMGKTSKQARGGNEIRKIDVLQHNRNAWNKYVDEGQSDWVLPVSHADVENARQGKMVLQVTPRKPVPASWLPDLHECETLCLASGGGQQAPLLAAAGAKVTVLDNSPRQLETDVLVANREDVEIAAVQGDMSNLSMFPDETFSLIIHPVSNVFVPDVKLVWREAARVLKTGGILIAGLTNPVVYLFDDALLTKNQLIVSHKIPYSPFNDDARIETDATLKVGRALEFGHTLQDQIGGQLDAGLVITGFYEDNNRDNVWSVLDDHIAIYIATRAVK